MHRGLAVLLAISVISFVHGKSDNVAMASDDSTLSSSSSPSSTDSVQTTQSQMVTNATMKPSSTKHPQSTTHGQASTTASASSSSSVSGSTSAMSSSSVGGSTSASPSPSVSGSTSASSNSSVSGSTSASSSSSVSGSTSASPSPTASRPTTSKKPSSTTSRPTTSGTPSPIAQGNKEPKMPAGFGKISSADLSTVQTLCKADDCINVTSSCTLQKRDLVRRLWMTVLAQTSLYKQNSKMAAAKAESYIRKTYIAKYILMRVYGFPAKLVKPADDGLMEGDVMLPDTATDAIIALASSLQSELKADDELNALLAEYENDFTADGDLIANANADGCDDDRGDDDNEGKRSASAKGKVNHAQTRSGVAVDQYRAVAWSSTIFYSFDKRVDDQNKAVVRKALAEISNTTGCIKFVERKTVAEYQLSETIVFFAMPSMNDTLENDSPSNQTCVISSAARLQLNFVFVDFNCSNVEGEVMHGVLHVLGVTHEHNRIDRDDYITINWAKLKPSYLDYFLLDQPQFLSTFGTKFDNDSIMFYPPTIGVAKSGDMSFVSKNDTSGKFGQRDHLSSGDAEILQRMYCNSSPACVDRKSLCGIYATKQLCLSKDNWYWMKNNCAKSCGLCK